jgi:hypothetical protein
MTSTGIRVYKYPFQSHEKYLRTKKPSLICRPEISLNKYCKKTDDGCVHKSSYCNSYPFGYSLPHWLVQLMPRHIEFSDSNTLFVSYNGYEYGIETLNVDNVDCSFTTDDDTDIKVKKSYVDPTCSFNPNTFVIMDEKIFGFDETYSSFVSHDMNDGKSSHRQIEKKNHNGMQIILDDNVTKLKGHGNVIYASCMLSAPDDENKHNDYTRVTLHSVKYYGFVVFDLAGDIVDVLICKDEERMNIQVELDPCRNDFAIGDNKLFVFVQELRRIFIYE